MAIHAPGVHDPEHARYFQRVHWERGNPGRHRTTQIMLETLHAPSKSLLEPLGSVGRDSAERLRGDSH